MENKAIWHNRSLLILGFSESVSNTGNWITMMAVFSLVIFSREGGVVESSGIFLAGLLPTLVFSPLAGWLLDRFDRKRLMIASEILSGLVITALIFVQQLTLIYLILALQAVFITLMTPARQAVLPDMVSRKDLPRANAFLQQLAGLIKIGAPVLAGALLAVVDAHTAIVLDVISFGLSALILTRLPSLPPHSQPAAAQAETPEAETVEGEQPALKDPQLWTTLRQETGLQLLFTTLFLAITVIIGFDVLAPVYIRDILQANEELFGLQVGLVGVGTLAASLLVMLRKGESQPWSEAMLGLLLLGMIPLLLAVGAWLGDPILGRWLALAACLVGGFGNGLLVVQGGTLLQLLSPSALLGRMSGLFQSVAVAGQLIGLLLTPLLVPAILSVAAFFGLSALALTALALYGLFGVNRPQRLAQGAASD